MKIFVTCCQNFEINFTHPYWPVGSRGHVSSRQCISCKNVRLVFKSTFSSENKTKNTALSGLYPLFVSWGSMNCSEWEEFIQCRYLPSFVKATLEKIQWPQNASKAFLQKEAFVCVYYGDHLQDEMYFVYLPPGLEMQMWKCLNPLHFNKPKNCGQYRVKDVQSFSSLLHLSILLAWKGGLVFLYFLVCCSSLHKQQVETLACLQACLLSFREHYWVSEWF